MLHLKLFIDCNHFFWKITFFLCRQVPDFLDFKNKIEWDLGDIRDSFWKCGLSLLKLGGFLCLLPNLQFFLPICRQRSSPQNRQNYTEYRLLLYMFFSQTYLNGFYYITFVMCIVYFKKWRDKSTGPIDQSVPWKSDDFLHLFEIDCTFSIIF